MHEPVVPEQDVAEALWPLPQLTMMPLARNERSW
jgi:hypothetical protein